MLFLNRKEAGQQLAGRLAAFANRADVIILSLIPGGVPVGFEISYNLHLNFDVLPIFKFYSPYNLDYAFGATTLNDISYFDTKFTTQLNIHEERIKFLKIEAQFEIEKINLIYRNGRKWTNIEDKIVILVDDGSCSQDDLFFASKLIIAQEPKSIILASPILTLSLYEKLENDIENIIFIEENETNAKITSYYQDLSKVSDVEVSLLLERTNYQKLMN